jgi:hypothetical protein
MINAYKIFVVKHEGKRPLGSHECRCDDNIRMDLGLLTSQEGLYSMQLISLVS